MRLPAPLLRRKPDVHKKDFGHVCVLAGSARMLGAAALTSLAAMRSGAGLVTVGVPQSLNGTLQKKISNVIMTWPLKETKEQTLSLSAFKQIQAAWDKFDVIAVGPGLSAQESTQALIRKMIAASPVPLVIDADALNALAGHLDLLQKTKTPKILTPHPGEMTRLVQMKKEDIERHRREVAEEFAVRYQCVLVLKGHQTVVASPDGKVYVNKTGNPGMATAGSGDVLTGMIAAFLGQGLSDLEAARWGVYLHGKAGDLAAQSKTRPAMIASDIIEEIPNAFKKVVGYS